MYLCTESATGSLAGQRISLFWYLCESWTEPGEERESVHVSVARSARRQVEPGKSSRRSISTRKEDPLPSDLESRRILLKFLRLDAD